MCNCGLCRKTNFLTLFNTTTTVTLTHFDLYIYRTGIISSTKYMRIESLIHSLSPNITALKVR